MLLFYWGPRPRTPRAGTRPPIIPIWFPPPEPAFGVGHSTTFSNCCSGASQTIKMHDEVSDSAIIASTPIKKMLFDVFFDPKPRKTLTLWKSDNAPVLPCKPQHFPAGQKCFSERKRYIRATRQVLWPAWQHCWVVRFPSSTDDEGLWVQKNIKIPLFFIGLEATMAESETSSSILIVWLQWEHYFGKVVLWR